MAAQVWNLLPKPKLNIPIDKNNATQGPVFPDENKDDLL